MDDPEAPAEPLIKREAEEQGGYETGDASQEGTSTVAMATFNMVNIFVGLGLLSMPWAMREAGWLGLLSLAAAVGLFGLSGALLVRCFDALAAAHPGVAHTYPNLGVAAFGPAGKFLIGGFAVAEFFGGSCGILILIWQELASFLPRAGVGGLGPLPLAALLSVAATVPVLLIPSFRRLSWLSLLGCLSTAVVLLAVLATFAADPSRAAMPEQPPAGHSFARWGILQATGIFAVSVSGHSSLPALRRSLKRPHDFDRVMAGAFGFMLLVYGSVAGLGYYYWGDAASVLITTDLTRNSVFTGRAILGGLTADGVVRICILVNAFTTYPCIVLVIQDMVWAMLPSEVVTSGWGRHSAGACRLAVLALGCGVAWLARDALGAVLSLVGGSCSLTCSLLFPALCYLRLGGRRLGRWQRGGLVLMLAAGACLLVLIVGQDVWALRGRPGRQTGRGRGLGGWLRPGPWGPLTEL